MCRARKDMGLSRASENVLRAARSDLLFAEYRNFEKRREGGCRAWSRTNGHEVSTPFRGITESLRT